LPEYLSTVEDIDFDFKNTPVKIVVIRDSPELIVGEKSIGPLKSGQDIETPYWISEELVRSGIAKFRDEDRLGLAALSKVHWKETIPTSRQIPQLPEKFYSMLRRFLLELEADTRSDQTKSKDLEKAIGLSKDIVSCRARKIVSLAAAPLQTESLIQNLTSEERALYMRLSDIINDWKMRILSLEGRF